MPESKRESDELCPKCGAPSYACMCKKDINEVAKGGLGKDEEMELDEWQEGSSDTIAQALKEENPQLAMDKIFSADGAWNLEAVKANLEALCKIGKFDFLVPEAGRRGMFERSAGGYTSDDLVAQVLPEDRQDAQNVPPHFIGDLLAVDGLTESVDATLGIRETLSGHEDGLVKDYEKRLERLGEIGQKLRAAEKRNNELKSRELLSGPFKDVIVRGKSVREKAEDDVKKLRAELAAEKEQLGFFEKVDARLGLGVKQEHDKREETAQRAGLAKKYDLQDRARHKRTLGDRQKREERDWEAQEWQRANSGH